MHFMLPKWTDVSSAINNLLPLIFRTIMYWKLVEYPEGKVIPLGEDILKYRVSNEEIEKYKKLKAEKHARELEKKAKL